MFEYVILDLIYIFTPFLLYMISSFYSYSLKEKENKIVLTFTTLTSFYLICRFGQTPYDHVLLLINVPLLIGYYKKQNYLLLFISGLLIVYYNFYFGINILILIIVYGLLYIFNKYIKKKNTLIISYIILNFIIAMLTKMYFWKVVLLLIVCIISYLILELLKISEKLIDLNTRIQQFEQEKQIKNNLFKITHEIKNPIAVCKGYLDMFDENNKNHLKYIPIIKDEINRTLTLLEDYLSMGKIKINKDILDVNCLVEDVTNSFIPILKTKKINYRIKLDDEELLIWGDYNRLNQVLTNVIKNAIESISENGNIEITTKLNDKIKIIIKDNGCGMSKDVIEKIKEPFYTTKKRGTGLGVSLSYEIIQANEGNIKYQSKINEGTIVTILLPLYKC